MSVWVYCLELGTGTRFRPDSFFPAHRSLHLCRRAVVGLSDAHQRLRGFQATDPADQKPPVQGHQNQTLQ